MNNNKILCVNSLSYFLQKTEGYRNIVDPCSTTDSNFSYYFESIELKKYRGNGE